MKEAVAEGALANATLSVTQAETIDVMTALVKQLTERVIKLEARVAELEDVRPSMGP